MPLIDGFLDDGLIILAGTEGVGKTFLAIHVGVHIATGVSWYGRDVESGAVIYCSAESV